MISIRHLLITYTIVFLVLRLFPEILSALFVTGIIYDTVQARNITEMIENFFSKFSNENCQAILKNGNQCPLKAKDSIFCKRNAVKN